MEMSHRGKEFQSIIDAAEADLRALLSIPDNYRVLFLQARQGGGRQEYWVEGCSRRAGVTVCGSTAGSGQRGEQ